MDIIKTLHPGDMGTKKHLREYGDQLICVRYRISQLTQKRYTTIELIVDEKPMVPPRQAMYVWIKLKFDETELRSKLISAGAKWKVEEKVWELNYEVAKKLKLKNRVVKRINRNTQM